MMKDLKFSSLFIIIGIRISIFCERFSITFFVYFIKKVFCFTTILFELYWFYNAIASLPRTAQNYVILYVNLFMRRQKEEEGNRTCMINYCRFQERFFSFALGEGQDVTDEIAASSKEATLPTIIPLQLSRYTQWR